MKNKTNDFLAPAPEGYKWPRCPEADRFIEGALNRFLNKHAFARRLSERMRTDTSTRFVEWADHLALPAKTVSAGVLEKLGFWEDKKTPRPPSARVFFHPFADLPRLLVSSRIKEEGCAIKVDECWRFLAAHGLTKPIQGAPYSTYRITTVSDGASELSAVERRGSRTFVPDTRARADLYVKMFETWAMRPRFFKTSGDGMKHTLKMAKDLVKAVGTGQAAWIFLETERVYWQSRNRAAQVQKARQDKLGLGWANHDHHTFRSSRACFPALIQILLTLGFKKRERYFAGAEAGWGAQIVEQPDAGLVIFADVDLAPGEVDIDFSKVVMPELSKHRTVGLWCALHGDSMLESGMHHLEAKFDFDQLRTDLKTANIETMPPFSDFSFLRQAFTKAEMWRVPEARLQRLYYEKKISDEAYQQIKANGAVGSHMENLERREGFKGFNQKGVSHIITAVNPEKQAVGGA